LLTAAVNRDGLPTEEGKAGRLTYDGQKTEDEDDWGSEKDYGGDENRDYAER
jgi:hypothetical protein